MPGLKVSIIIPVYNGANYLREAIDSALAQTWPATEVVVVNDGSRDDGATEAIALSYGDRIRYVAKPNGGVASALNAGIAAMRGDIFCWLSHDDRHMPHKTARQVAKWERLGRPDAVLFSDYRLIGADGAPITDVQLDHAMLAAKPLYALLRGSIHGCSVFVPRRLFEVVGLFNETLPTTQDYDLWYRMIQHVPFLHLPEVLIESRWHDEQASKRIDHRVEATAFWIRVIESVPEREQQKLEGSSYCFLLEMANFLNRNALPEAGGHIAAMADRALSRIMVTAIIPVYNRFHLAVSAIESVAALTHPTMEIIIVDDGSTDDISILEAAVARHAPLARLLRQPNRGPAAARNAAWELARGRYVAFLDADDLWMPEKIALQLRLMEGVGAAFSHTSYYRHMAGVPRLSRISSGAGNSFPSIIGSCGIATPTVMLRRDLWDEGFRFPENFAHGEDVVLWLRVAARYGVSGIDTALTVVRAGPDSTAFNSIKQAEGVGNILAAVRETPELACHGHEVDRLAALAAEFASGPERMIA
jgi:hypothetical protein